MFTKCPKGGAALPSQFLRLYAGRFPPSLPWPAMDTAAGSGVMLWTGQATVCPLANRSGDPDLSIETPS